MWNRISGKSSDTKPMKDDVSTQSTRRNGDDSRSTKRRSDSGSVVYSSSDKKSSSRGDDRDRGFNPTSTSYSSTSKSAYPGTASASIASSYATAGWHDDEPYMPPGLVRNASLADQMPKSRSSRSSRETEEDLEFRTDRRRKEDRNDDLETRDRGDRKREKREKRDNKDTDDRALRRSESGFGKNGETSRGPADFPDQIGGAGFSQFPGQYDGALPSSSSAPQDHPPMSSHVQDQFPGQFPTQSTEPYRPPAAASEGGPGLAAEYYGDNGQSVHEQPGFRKHSPSMIVNAEPHLLPASVEHKPPPEPSASGGVGAAASFFNGSFEEDEVVSGHGQQQPSTYSTAPSRPDNYHSSSAPAMPTIGGAALGAAAGYFISNQTSSHQQPSDDAQSVAGAQSEYASTTYQRPPFGAQGSFISNESRPSKPGKLSSHSSNIPTLAAGAAGAAGLAAAAYQQSHHPSSQQHSSMVQYPNQTQHPTTPMMQRHRHRGPFGALVDFFKDPDGVAQFEEYSEITGVCKYCFEPGSSPRDAPRRHRYLKRRSNERLGSSTRVDKDSRYYSSENENRRNKDKSWLATGLAGYGLAKVGESLFKQQNDFDDTYSVKTGRYSPNRRSQTSRRRSRSKDRVETGVTSDGNIYKKDSHGGVFGGPSTTSYSTLRRSKSRSRSRDRKSDLTEAALGAVVGASIAGSTSQRRSHSPKGAFVRTSHQSRSRSPERRRKSHKKKKEKGFFSFGGSSSSSSVDLGRTEKHGSSKKSSKKSSDDRKAEAALLGLGAAAAALALNDGRQGHKKKGVKELIGVKETRDRHDRGHRNGYKPPEVSSRTSEDEGWESAAEDDQGSVDLGLAYGAPARRGSRESLSSESSGTNKWGWRWGSKKERRGSPPKRMSSDHSNVPSIAGAVGAGLAGAAMMSPDQYPGHGIDSTTSVPLQHVFPVPTSDPGRFDVGREGSVTSTSRPGIVPIQHPQPITPVSAALYSSQAPHEHSYSAPTGPSIFSQPTFQPRPTVVDARYNVPQYGIPGGFSQDNQQVRDVFVDPKLRRRDTSPARFGIDSIASSMTPRRQPSAQDDISAAKAGTENVASSATSRRRSSTKNDSSAVRFDMTEEQEEEARRERRRRKREEKQRREVDEQEQIKRDDRVAGDKSTNYDDAKRDEKSADKSWAAPAAVGIAGAAIGIAAAVERSKPEETRDERRERRRREREEEEAQDEEKSRRRERRRKERERDREAEASNSKEVQKRSDDLPEALQDVDQQVSHDNEKSIWQEAASAKNTHENYGDFFTPIELRNRSNDQVKVTSANADADVDLIRSPNIVAIGPKGYRDPDALPEFSKADTDDKIEIKFPWQLAPRLRLVEPTPPSTRGSTPVIQPKSASDDDVEELPSKPSASKVTWGNDQTHEFTVITPHDEREEFVESPDEDHEREPAGVFSSINQGETTPDHEQQEQPVNDTPHGNGPISHGEDLEFAATLAASAEDAGFDPSIVIDDPAYRRRDSPRGSNDRSMPGGFDDGDEPNVSKRERKRKDKAVRRQSKDEPNGRDDDAIVKDIVSQVQDSEPQDTRSDTVKGFDDEWDSEKKSKSKKSKKGREDSGTRDGFRETSESVNESQSQESRQIYDSPTEDTQSVVSSAVSGKNGESSRKSRKKSKRGSRDDDDVTSTVSTQASTGADHEKPKEKRKESIWSRVLGKSADSLPQENGAKDLATEADAEDFEEPKRKSKHSKERRSTRDGLDDEYARSEVGTTRMDSRRRRSGGSAAQNSGRIAQDLPTKDREPTDESEQVDEKRYESFLGERPEPPPPPNLIAEEKKPPDPAIAIAPPITPRSPPNDQTRQTAEFQTPEPLRSPTALPSPTAVPFHRHRPRPPPGSGRSLSQTPLSSTQIAGDVATQQKPRPRSTEFKSSKEFRPLWLVEKNMPRQEPSIDETYPSLPSSHTTTPASSVHDPDEYMHDALGDYQMPEASHEPTEGVRSLSIYTHNNGMSSDLLGSQQATPTASTFQRATNLQDLPSLPASRASSPTFMVEDDATKASSTVEDASLAAVVGGSAAHALHKATQHNQPPRQHLSQEEDKQFQQGLDDMTQDPITHRSLDDGLLATGTLTGDRDEQSQQALEEFTPEADADQPQNFEDAFEDNFAPQTAKKSKKSKRKTSTAGQTKEPTSTTEIEPAASRDMQPKPLSPEDLRQLQERDAKDAVDSWFESPASSIKDKKKKKRQGVTDEPLEQLNASSAGIGLPGEVVEQTEPMAIQEDSNLTQDMSRDRVVDIMTTAAQGENSDEVEAFESARKVDEGPIENLLLRRQSKSKGKKSKKGRKNTLKDDVLTTPPIASKGVHFANPFSQEFGKDQPRPRQDGPTNDEGLESTEERTAATSSRVDISPLATPLPIDDDLDLIEEQSKSPINGAEDRNLYHEQNFLPQGPSKTAPLEEVTKELRDPPTQPSQNAVENSPNDSNKEGEKGKMAQETSTDTGDNAAFSQEIMVPESTSEAIQIGPYQVSTEEVSADVPERGFKVAEDEWGGISSKKKGRKGKRSRASESAELDTVATVEEEAALHVPMNNDDQQIQDPVGESKVDIPTEEDNAAENDWGSFSTKKGKKGKKVKQNVTDETRADLIDNEESAVPLIVSKIDVPEQTQELVNEPIVGAPQVESGEAEDEVAGFGADERGQKGKKPDMRPFDVETAIEQEQVEPGSDQREPTNDDRPTATTTTSREVASMLQNEKGESPTDQNLNRSSYIDAEAHRELQGPVLERTLDSRNPDSKFEMETKNEAEPSETRYPKTFASQTNVEATDPVPICSAATTDTAKVTHVIRGDDVYNSVPHDHDEMSIPHSAIEEASTDTPTQSDKYEPDWAAPKKSKKAKKSKKSEVFSFDESETTEPTNVPTPPAQLEPHAEQESRITSLEHAAADQVVEEKQIDWAAPKKTKKGKKGRTPEASSLEEPGGKEPSGLSTPILVNEPSVQRELGTETSSHREDTVMAPPSVEGSVADKAVEKLEPDQNTLNDQVFAYDAFDGNETQAISALPVEVGAPIVQDPDIELPRSQEDNVVAATTTEDPLAEQLAADAGADWDAPRKRKGKKGKKNQVFAYDLDNPESQVDAAQPVEFKPSATLELANERADGFPTKKTKDKKAKKGRKGEASSWNEPENAEALETSTPPFETKPLADGERVTKDAGGFSPGKSKKDKKGKTKSLSRTTSGFEDASEDQEKTIPELSLPKDAAPTETSKSVEPPTVDPAESIEEVISDKVREPEALQEDIYTPPQSYKGKESKEKSLSKTPSHLEDTSEYQDNEPRSTTANYEPAIAIEQQPELSEPTGSTEREIDSDKVHELGPSQDEDFMPPKSKKNKKKAKRSNVFNWDDDGASTLESEPVSESRSLAEDTFNNSIALDDAQVEQQKAFEDDSKSKNDRKESRTSQLVSSKDDMIEQAKELPKSPPVPSENLRVEEATGPLIRPEEHLMPNYEDQAPLHENDGFDSVKPMPPTRASNDVSSFPGQEHIVTEDDQHHKNKDIEANIDPTVNANIFHSSSLKNIENGEKESKAGEENDAQRQRNEISEKSGAREDPSTPTIVPMPQDAEDWSTHDRLAEVIEPTDVLEPYDKPPKLERAEQSEPASKSSEQTVGLDPLLLIDRDDDLAPLKKSKKGKKRRKEAQVALDEPVMIDSPVVVGVEDTRDLVDDASGPPLEARIETPAFSAMDLSATAVEVEMLDEEEQREYDRRYSKELDRQDLEGPHGSITNEPPITPVDEESRDAQEQPEYREHYADAEAQRTETSMNPTAEPATPPMEIEMLDAQEQREYDNEYARELERQLSPLQDEEQPGNSSQPNETYDPATSNSGIDTVMEQRISERPHGDVHLHLAQAPSLEDIIEESRSRSGSVQESSAAQEDDFSTFKSTKKSKKGKKGKRQQQPVIWEDETATPPIGDENEKAADAPIDTLDLTGSLETDAPNRPIDLEEHIEHKIIDMTPSAERGPSEAHENAEDYFAIRPSRGAEEDVQVQRSNEFDRAILTEQSRAQSPRWEQHPGQVEQIYHHEPRDESTYDNDESSPTTIPEPPASESIPVESLVDDEVNYAPSRKSKKSKKSKRRGIEEEPSFSNLPLDEFAQDASHPEILADDYGDTESASRDRSSQRSPRNGAGQKSKAEERSRSPGKYRDTGRLAAAGLGIGAIAAEGLSRVNSKKEGTKGKRSKKSSRKVEFEEEPGAPESTFEGEKPIIEHSKQVARPEQQSTTSAWLQSQATSPQPPLPHAYPEYGANELPTSHVHQPSGGAAYRDSAIHVSDSPIAPEDASNHRPIRDSGYPETETSPTLELEPQDHAMHAQRSSGDFDDGALEEDIIDEYDEEPSTSSYRPPVAEYEISRGPEDLRGNGSKREIIDEYDESPRNMEHSRSDAADTFSVPVEADPDYDISVSRPSEDRRRSRRRSGGAYDSDDSADSGFDIRRRRRLQAKADEPREPSPVSSTTKDRSSALFGSSPSAREEVPDQPHEPQTPSRGGLEHEAPTWSFGHEGPPLEQPRDTPETNRSPFQSEETMDLSTYEKSAGHRGPPPSLFGGPIVHDDETISPPSSDIRGRPRLNTISEGDQERLSLHKKDKRADSDVGSPEAGVKERRTRSPAPSEAATGRYISTGELLSSEFRPVADEERDTVDLERNRSRGTDEASSRQSNNPNLPMFPAKYREGDRKTSNSSAQSDNSIHAIIRTPDQVRSASGQSFRSSGTRTPPLRRVDRSASGDLRGASKLSEAKTHARNFEAEPDININNIPSSSTYDPVTDKGKNRVDMADVYEAYGNARGQSPMSPTRPPSMRKRQSMQMLDLETRLDQLVSENRLLQGQKSTAERSLQDQARDHSQQRHAYEEAMQEHKMFLSQKDSELNELKQILEEWQSKVTHLTQVNEEMSSRGLDEDHHQRYRELETEHADLREQHTQLSTGMESIVQHEVAAALEEKNVELRQLRNELDNAKQQVRNLQQQLLTSRASDDFVERDDDYFDGQCQALCQHVQQWVLRFSKFSDMKACYRASEVRDEKVVDRMENALLDGTDFDESLQDRVKRRDVFMSVVMTMVWEFIFTRYLFGMDREQRQKLKNLEKTLQEVGPVPAVYKWRATTLTLLMKRQSFEIQRETDTEAVVQEIYDTLARFLPPPSHLVSQIQDSLRKVINAAVDLSIEMRTQRADYQMLPPLVPEYDTNGDLVGKVRFNALTMNERSGATSTNEALEEQEAVVRMVLFPLVVRTEEDDEQIVVCPAQVLTAQGSKGKKSVRVMSAQGGRSEASFGGSEGGMI